jgi:AraC-like DNA-binding protein
MLCDAPPEPAANAGGDICFMRSRISPRIGCGTLDLVSFDRDLVLLGMRGYFHDDLSYQGIGEGWTRFHFRKSARTLMEFDGIAASELEGPLCQMLHQPVGVPDTEWIEGRTRFDWVTLMMRPHLLVDRFKLDSIHLCDPVRRLAYGADEFLLENWSLSAEMMLAMDQLLGNPYSGDLRLVHLEAKAVELVCMMSRVLGHRVEERAAVRLRPRDIDAIHEVRRILARSLTERPSIEALARQVGINRNKLTTGFKQLFDQTTSEYWIECRLQAGWQLLQDSALPVAVVAGRVGYAQSAAFSTAFRQHFGVTPRSIRRR